MNGWTKVRAYDYALAIFYLSKAELAKGQKKSLIAHKLVGRSVLITPNRTASIVLLRELLHNHDIPFLVPASSRRERVSWWWFHELLRR